MAKCSRCGSRDIEKGKIINFMETSVTREGVCLRCGHVFSFDELVPREKAGEVKI